MEAPLWGKNRGEAQGEGDDAYWTANLEEDERLCRKLGPESTEQTEEAQS